MTFGTLIDRVKFTMGMQEIVSHNEVETLIKPYINEGIVDILSRCRPYARSIQLQLTADTAIHDMASSILALLDLQDSSGRFLQRFSREDITKLQTEGSPGFAYEEPLLWISPIPGPEAVVTAYGIFRPDPLSAPGDDPQMPNFGGLAPEFHPAIVNYACWKAGEYTQHDSSQMGEKWRVAYEGRDGTEGDIARIKRILTKRVTPQAARKRDLTGNLGALSESGSYMGG